MSKDFLFLSSLSHIGLSSDIIDFLRPENLLPTGFIERPIAGIEKLVTQKIFPSFLPGVFLSKYLLDVPEIVDFRVIERYGMKEFIVFIEEPNWDAEEMIYRKYFDFLKEVSEAPDLRVIHLLNRKTDEVLDQL